MDIIIGSHRLRDHAASYVVERKQKSKINRVSWRPITYPRSVGEGLKWLLKYELKARTEDCTELRQLSERSDLLMAELMAAVQPIDASMRAFPAPV